MFAWSARVCKSTKEIISGSSTRRLDSYAGSLVDAGSLVGAGSLGYTDSLVYNATPAVVLRPLKATKTN